MLRMELLLVMAYHSLDSCVTVPATLQTTKSTSEQQASLIPAVLSSDWLLGHGRSSSSLQLRYQASYWRQLAVLSRRLGKATWVDPMLLAMNWGAALLMALGLGIVYWHATRDTGQQPHPLSGVNMFCAQTPSLPLI